ncbi:MAG: hypothetical protein ACI4EF_06820 [Coprococcus sp.]
MEHINDDDVIVINNIAFTYVIKGDLVQLIGINLKNEDQMIVFNLIDNDFICTDTNMSGMNKHKCVRIVEKNKQQFIDGFRQHQSM